MKRDKLYLAHQNKCFFQSLRPAGDVRLAYLEDNDECPEGEEAVPAGLQRLEAQLVQEGRVVGEGAQPHGGPELMNALMNELKIN